MTVKRDFIEACYGRPVGRRPIWIMRQAGRYQASYRAVRTKHSFDELCHTPELAAQVTLDAVRQFDLDAAIIFSDIMVILPPMGLPVTFAPGPKIAVPIRRPDQIARLKPLDPRADVGYVMNALRQVRAALPEPVGLIGFSGAPFTLACYAIEGETSREYPTARQFFYREPDAAEQLMKHFADAIADYLNAQIDAGADAVQLFDSWGGLLSAADYRRWVLPHMQAIIAKIRRPNVPVILYVNGSSHLVDALSDTRCDVVSVDWRTDLPAAAAKCAKQTALQGNLDPVALLGTPDEIRRRVDTIVDEMDTTGKGHVFNLGHGILPPTPEENLRVLVEHVHARRPRLQTAGNDQ
ncbi:MAG TPA: uroporphyrinogen decarboxylase [Acidobacteriota bacterium]|nr:uroporphyrinogen decarboxylase [Acidobacteriota bacterium]